MSARERIVSQALDPAVLGGELMIIVVHVAACRLRRSVTHDPLKPRELGSWRGHVKPAEGVSERVRVSLLDRHARGKHAGRGLPGAAG